MSPHKILLLAASVAGLAACPAQENGPNRFVLWSPEVADGGILPVDFTGDGSSATLPLEWEGAPSGTAGFALIMHHVDPEGRTKWYWTLYNIPADIRSLPRNARGIGTLGNNSINGRTKYAPPHSKGPGEKLYIYTIYALSAPPRLDVEPAEVSRDVLLSVIKDSILGTAELRVVCTRHSVPHGGREGIPPVKETPE